MMTESPISSAHAPPRAETAGVDAGHDVALSLFNLIARAEHWWEANAQAPSRHDILSCYADCVAVVRGNPAPAPEIEASDPVPPIGNEMESGATVEIPPHYVTHYAIAQDLAAGPDVPQEPELLVVNEGFSLEA
jgi:hypothetical protein